MSKPEIAHPTSSSEPQMLQDGEDAPSAELVLLYKKVVELRRQFVSESQPTPES